MKKLNTPVGIIFGLLSLVNLVGGDWLSAGLNALLAVGIWLSDLAYVPASAGPRPLTGALPTWRRYVSLALVLAGLALFGYQIGRDMKAKTHPAATPARKGAFSTPTFRIAGAYVFASDSRQYPCPSHSCPGRPAQVDLGKQSLD